MIDQSEASDQALVGSNPMGVPYAPVERENTNGGDLPLSGAGMEEPASDPSKLASLEAADAANAIPNTDDEPGTRAGERDGDAEGASVAVSVAAEGPDDVLSADDAERATLLSAWRSRPGDQLSLPEVNGSVRVAAADKAWYRKFWSYAGLGFLISVGYMDPGNWATDLAAGSAYGYTLLVAILLANMLAIFYQACALKLGVVTERDLAQCCRDAYPRWVIIPLWLLSEVAIAATDLAEIIGSAIALNLLFGLPVWAGCLITFADVLFILVFGTKNFRFLELLVFALCALITGCFTYEIAVIKPNWLDILKGLIPKPSILANSGQLFNAIGILGATCMPHNIFLGSSIIQTRAFPRNNAGKRQAIFYGTWDVSLSLMIAFFVNAAILITAAGAFHYGPNPNKTVQYISDAYRLLAPAVGSNAAKILFGVALLASGQNSTITGTLAGQIVMEGFLRFSLPPWQRRMVTRLVAMVPATIVAGIAGSRGAGKLLVLSQVIISFTLFFVCAPLVHFTNSAPRMGRYRNNLFARWFGAIVTLIIGGLNAYLIIISIKDNEFGNTTGV